MARLKKISISAIVVTSLLLGFVGQSAQATEEIVKDVPLSEEERSAALWYADRLKFDDLLEKGATGEGIKIAVIDTAINLDAAELQGANIEVMGSFCAFPETGEIVPAVSDDVERSGHGTSVVSMLVGNGIAADGGLGTRGIVPDAEIMFYAEGLGEEQVNPDGPTCENYDAQASEFHSDKNIGLDEPGYFLGTTGAYAAWHAIDHGADIIVYSAINNSIFGWNETVIKGIREGVPIVAGTPNPIGEIEPRSYPFTLNGVVAVSGVTEDGKILHGDGYETGNTFAKDAPGSNNLGFVSAASYLLAPNGKTDWAPSYGSGTSLATPLVAGILAIGMQKFPDASANQVLQAMIRTTGNDGLHDPNWIDRKWGYGIANPSNLLESDPTQYTDENPLFIYDYEDPRCIFADGTSFDLDNIPEGIEGTMPCAWAIGPQFEDVWPTEPEPEQTAEEIWSDIEPAVSMWITAALIILGIIILAVTLIIVLVVRSRKKKARLLNTEN